MGIEENQYRICKRSRYSNGKLGLRENHQDEDDGGAIKGEVNDISSTFNSMRQWNHPSSRIIRVSRALGGKDRHSKVYTSKGLRDRRVRLSVSTAIQFYDLQDRLGYDQPSKAIEWLIKSAESAISELPSLDTAYPESMNMQINIKKTMLTDSGNNQQQNSSNSETSKGSELSLSRSEIRVKARERARERVKDKEKDQTTNDPGLNSWGSFCKLLTACQVSSSTADYFCTQSRITQDRIPSGFSSQTHFGNNSPIGMVPFVGNGTDHSLEMQQFSFLHDNISPVVTTEGDYNLNFSKSSSLAGFYGETLQSNSPFHHNLQNHHQVQAHKNSSTLDAQCMPFFFGVAANAAAATSSTDQNQYSSGFDGHLQLFDGYKHLELKRKGKN